MNFHNKKVQRIISAVIVIIIVLAMIATTIFAYADDTEDEEITGTVTDGVYVEETDISSMTYDEALAAVKEYVKSITSTEVTLNVNGNEVTTTVGKLGYKWSNKDIIEEAVTLGKSGNVVKRYKDVLDLKEEGKVYELEMSISEDTIEEKVEELCSEYNVEAQNATLTKSGSSFVITDEVEGTLVDSAATAEEIYNYICNEWDKSSSITIDVATDVDEPEVTAEDCELVSTTPMGTYTTYFSTGGNYANRCLNIQNGAEHLDGSVIYPGESYSVNEHLEERNAENGYYLAGTYVDGTTQDSYGGGICQVSSTLYNALLLAEIDITKRSPHSMSVSYVPLSQDAAIAGDYKDLVFENNTEAPIYIEAIFSSGGSITFNVYGYDTRDSGRTVEYVSKTTSTTSPEVNVTKSDEYPEGYEEIVSTGHTGYTAELWKYVYQDGELVSEEKVNSSTYAATDTEKIVGTGKSDDEEETEEETEKDEDEDEEETTTKKKSKKSDETTTKKSDEETTTKSE